jgi:hypothetical protein
LKATGADIGISTKRIFSDSQEFSYKPTLESDGP